MDFINKINFLKSIENHKKQKLCAGFTLIETIIAIFILIVGTIVIYGIFFDMAKQANNYPNKLTAFYLAQEGIEIIKNIRDDNWVKNTSGWLDRIDNGDCLTGCDFEVDYKAGTDGQLIPYVNEGRFLNIDSNNIYSYNNSGNYSQTIYKRKITISGFHDPSGSDDVFLDGSDDYFIQDDIIKIISLVTWEYKGSQFSAQIEDYLYNWY
jgi:type II secretory pathway pseudopilin PulG